MNDELEPFLTSILNVLNAKAIKRSQKVQPLWNDYGGIYRLQLQGGDAHSVIVKCIDLKPQKAHPRGWSTDNSHLRKLRSYEIEEYWYRHFAPQITETTKVARTHYIAHQDQTQIIVMEDLASEFPVTKLECTLAEAKVVVEWLARFHAHFLGAKPNGLWPVGTYWHLATRQDELKKMTDSQLKASASQLDLALSQARFQTIVHGDAKAANFNFSQDGQKVAAVDFQYVGGGVGVKDLAYFLGSCLTETECQIHETELLNVYFSELLDHVEISNSEKENLENEWRKLYPVAWADFNRFLLGWMPTHHKLHDFALTKNEEALDII